MPEIPNPAENPPIDSRGAKSSDAAQQPEAQQPEAQHPSMPKIVPFTDLARCGEEIWISHQGQLYRLQSTRAGKLILTK
ncbi:hypothetical protein LF1_01650 [Rubripirellula obstinata]|uniref:Hemin uptake protein hemP n=1 Tax=Rubripirellula obstinata TaxID=406547 RepID=A0A5B1C977_9BACT|nr:hemin uptake protein HemP [Rubripirellula obstinata]KAA1257677.1 hypothetical protein LF1_01650 [Rubripirellula obstinata]